MHYEVDTAALRESALTIGEVLARVRRLGVTDDLAAVATAVPPGRTTAGAPGVALAWQARLAGLTWELRELGAGVSAAADGYDGAEQVARSALSGLSGLSGSRRHA
ncbi:hypothetical protein GCM10023258_31930 [Terrabacter aeriphilus]|uniref:Excreted virulence factor EspC (Type VII ESX diderm) n=1 Tax=Terrabacter aeriphilus TaxID=515662 RepID=A0ABP9JJQ4_9MICO